MYDEQIVRTLPRSRNREDKIWEYCRDRENYASMSEVLRKARRLKVRKVEVKQIRMGDCLAVAWLLAVTLGLFVNLVADDNVTSALLFREFQD